MASAQTTIASSSNSSLLSTAACARRWTYDAFLSFRGKDTRNGFAYRLYTALVRAGIYTFKDDEKLPKGEPISQELLNAIEESRVAVVIFSKNYANSSWCLEELAKIIECWDLMGQIVLPVFYNVDPSDVHGQKRSFHTAFEQHDVTFKENTEKVKRWREVLTTTANLSGWHVRNIASGREAECIKQIVSTILSYSEFHRDENIIGMESRVREVKSLLGMPSNIIEEIPIRYCRCSVMARMRTSCTQKNQGRRFYGCPNYLNKKQNCNYFCWVDPELPNDWYKENVFEMIWS